MTFDTGDGHDGPALWVRALDALAVVGVVVAGSIAVTGGFVVRFGPVVLSSHTPWKPLLVTAALLAVRHVAAPQRPLHRRMADGIASLRVEPRRSLLAVSLASRLAVLVAGYFAVLIIGVIVPAGHRQSTTPLRHLPVRWDASWYASIALESYRFHGRFDLQQNIAFFPAYPMLVRAAGALTGAFAPALSQERRAARALWGGVCLSILAFTWGALYVARLARETIGDARAPDAVALLAAYPFAAFFSAPYTEGVFLLGTVAAFYHFRRREWLAAGFWGAFVGFTRPNGCLMSIVLACIIAEHLWRTRRLDGYPFVRALFTAAMPGLAMLVHTAYLYQVTGVWFAWMRVQTAWGRSYAGLPLMERAFGWVWSDGLTSMFARNPLDALNGLALIFVLAMVWAVFRRVGVPAGVFVAINILPPLLTGGVLSMGRFTATLFPVFLALAALLPRPLLVPCLIAFAIGQGLIAAAFFTARPVF